MEPISPAELIDLLHLQESDTWAGRALLRCLVSLTGEQRRSPPGTAGSVTLYGATLRNEHSFDVVYSRQNLETPDVAVLGTVGDRDPEATLLLMPHVEPEDVPLDAELYGTYFAIVGVEEPFGPNDYTSPDPNGVRWFVPPTFRPPAR